MRTIFGLFATAGLGLMLQACGAGGSDANLAAFTGTWRPTSGTTTTTCPGYAAETDAVAGNISWARGVSSDLIQSDTGSSCVINADAMGSTASGAGPSCTFPDGYGGTMTLAVATYTFVLGADWQTAQENGSGTLVLTTVQGATLTCGVSVSASYQKISK